MSLAIVFELQGARQAVARLDLLSHVAGHVLLAGLGEEIVDQTKQRIEHEKTSPGGDAWAKTTDGRGALFVTGDHFARTVQAETGADQVEVGSGFAGARLFQYGGTVVPVKAGALVFEIGGRKIFAKKTVHPRREWLGLSPANEADLEATAAAYFAKVLP